MSVIRIRSAFGRPANKAFPEGSTYTFLPPASSNRLACWMGVRTTSPPEVCIVSGGEAAQICDMAIAITAGAANFELEKKWFINTPEAVRLALTDEGNTVDVANTLENFCFKSPGDYRMMG